MDASKKQTLMWMEYYGLARARGLSVYQTLPIVVMSADQAPAALSAVLGVNNALEDAAKARVEGFFQGASALASAIPVVGGFLGAVAGAIGSIVSPVIDAASISCDKGCSWPVSYERREFIGMNPPPRPHSVGVRTLISRLHDGLVVQGAGSGDDSVGRAVGVFSRIRSSAANAESRSNEMRSWPGAEQPPKGQFKDPEKGDPASWYGRAWRVQTLLTWAENKLPCAHLMCLSSQLWLTEQALVYAANGGGRPAGDRYGPLLQGVLPSLLRKGSRWYATLYWLHRDFWELAQRLGVSRTVPILQGLGAGDAAMELQAALTGKVYKPGEVPFAWTPVTGLMTWDQLCGSLVQMAAATKPAEVHLIKPMQVLRLSPAQAAGIATRAAAPVATPSGDPAWVSSGESSGVPTWFLPAGAAIGAIALVYLFTRR